MNRETKSQQEFNLSVLKRQDPAITSVNAISGFVAIYRFDEPSRSWARRGIEGTFFIVSRSEAPQYRLVVMNRLSTENLIEDISPDWSVQVSGPYLLYKKQNGDINGIWFYEDSEREIIAKNLLEIKDSLRAPAPSPAHALAAPPPIIAAMMMNQSPYQQPPPNFHPPPPAMFHPPVYPFQPPPPPPPQPTVYLPVSTSLLFNQASASSAPLPSTPVSTMAPPSPLIPSSPTRSHTVVPQPQPPPSSSVPSLGKLLTPSTFAALTLTPSSTSQPRNATRYQLQQAILNLVHDDSFIDLVYAEYLAVQQQQQ